MTGGNITGANVVTANVFVGALGTGAGRFTLLSDNSLLSGTVASPQNFKVNDAYTPDIDLRNASGTGTFTQGATSYTIRVAGSNNLTLNNTGLLTAPGNVSITGSITGGALLGPLLGLGAGAGKLKSISDIARDSGKAKAAMELLTRGATSYAKATPLIAAEAALTSKPIIASNWSGQTDFLNAESSILIDGALTKVHKSASWKGVINEDAEWFTIDYNKAIAYMKDVFKNYKLYTERSRKTYHHIKTNFSFEAMKEKVQEILRNIMGGMDLQSLFMTGVSAFMT
jgi:hypothetical protein